MKLRRAGFSVPEALVGIAITVIVIASGSQVLSSLSTSFKKAKALNSIQKIESLVRSGVFFQKDYSDLSKIEIKLGSVLIAKHNIPVYVSDDLTSSSLNPEHPIKVQLMMSQFLYSGSTRVGGVYQISYEDNKIKLQPVGVKAFPTSTAELKNALESPLTGYDPTLQKQSASQLMVVPKKFSAASEKACGDGFIRGLAPDNSGDILCWSFSDRQCPAWSVPVGYTLDSATSSIRIQCQKLNRVSCAPLQLTLSDGSLISLPNFQMYSEVSLTDLYPPRSSVGPGSSLCKTVVNFKAFSVDGKIPLANVTARSPASLGAVCPDAFLYTQESDGSCTPKFNVNNIQDSQIVVTPLVQGVTP